MSYVLCSPCISDTVLRLTGLVGVSMGFVLDLGALRLLVVYRFITHPLPSAGHIDLDDLSTSFSLLLIPHLTTLYFLVVLVVAGLQLTPFVLTIVLVNIVQASCTSVPHHRRPSPPHHPLRHHRQQTPCSISSLHGHPSAAATPSARFPHGRTGRLSHSRHTTDPAPSSPMTICSRPSSRVTMAPRPTLRTHEGIKVWVTATGRSRPRPCRSLPCMRHRCTSRRGGNGDRARAHANKDGHRSQ